MEQTEIWLVAGLAILCVGMCAYYVKSRRRFSRLLFGALSGAAFLFPAHWILTAMGYALSINLFTMLTAAILGIPGVAVLCAAVLL